MNNNFKKLDPVSQKIIEQVLMTYKLGNKYIDEKKNEHLNIAITKLHGMGDAYMTTGHKWAYQWSNNLACTLMFRSLR